jgi:O-antigen/teichoic acid export membrane protein
MKLETMPAALALESAAEPEAPGAAAEPETTLAVPQDVVRRIASGTSTLGVAVMLERGLGFVGNILAARLGGASTFGAYSLAITTANNIGTYAAGGIGSTATRFSGEYGRGTRGYPTLAKVLLLMSLVSGLIASLALWWGAAPLARLLQKESLTGLLSWAALSAAGVIVLECGRGFLIGQHRLLALLVLSCCTGLGMVVLVPLAAPFGPIPMILCQGGVAVGGIAVCVLLFRPLGLGSPVPISNPEPFLPMLKRVWSFGLVQLAGLVGVNAAGWWLTSLIARADGSMKQMGFFAISLQLRNMVALLPGLLSLSSYAAMAAGEDADERRPDRVMAACTSATALSGFLLGGTATLVLRWVLPLLYGKSYAGAEAAAAFALATAIVQMANSPASSRLSIVSLRDLGLINTAWAIGVSALATLLLFHGSALVGSGIYFGTQVCCGALVFVCLHRRGRLVPGPTLIFGVAAAASVLLSLLAILRSWHPGATWLLTGIMAGLFVAASLLLVRIGHRYRLLPSRAVLGKLLAHVPGFGLIRPQNHSAETHL